MDIGSNSICATLATTENEDFEIIHTVSVKSQGITKGVITDINLASEAVRNCSEKLSSATNLDLKDYYVGISNSQCRVIESIGYSYICSSENIIESEDIYRSIEEAKKISMHNDEEILDILIESFIIDGETITKNPMNLKGEKLEVVTSIILCKKEIINSYRNVFLLSKLNIKGFLLNSNSLKSILLNERTLGLNTLIIDVGAECTDLAYYEKNQLKFISSSVVGGENISRDLSICAKIPFEEAEKIKLQFSENYRTIFKKGLVNGLKVSDSSLDDELYYYVVNARLDEISKICYKNLLEGGIVDSINEIFIIGEGITNFEDIKYVFEDIFKKKVFIVTKNQLGLQNSSIINSIGIVKDAFDKVKLEVDIKILQAQKIKKIENKFEEENIKTDSKKKSWLKNLKRLIDDIF